MPLRIEVINYLVMFDEIDPNCRGLRSDLGAEQRLPLRTITLSHEAEPTLDKTNTSAPRRKIHFYTETIGDLYLAQGHPRLAAEVYRTLNERTHNPRLAEKLAEAQRRLQPAASSQVKKEGN
ncbi:MAG: hypothetical protein ACE5K8_08585 [Candidatus Zixiibacteriota bacterium]